LKVLGDIEEFNKAVQAVITTVRFDKDVNISVFETTIRVLGGLLSAHLQAEQRLPEYKVMNYILYIFFLDIIEIKLLYLGPIIDHVSGFGKSPLASL